MLFADVVNQGNVPVLEKMLAFTEARHRMLTENVANIDTPGYVARQLDPKAFQKALRKAIDANKAYRPSGDTSGGQVPFTLPASDQFRQDAEGRLVVTPGEQPPENVLFHDGTNARIERQMSMLAENAMAHQAATELLRSQFDGLLKAIRGTVR